VRFRTAAILSLLLVGGMFVFPTIMLLVVLPSLKQGHPNPLPVYEQMLLEIAVFFLTWRFFLALPIVGVLFTIAGLTQSKTPRTNSNVSTR
jgi:type II secretory pathway component PulF